MKKLRCARRKAGALLFGLLLAAGLQAQSLPDSPGARLGVDAVPSNAAQAALQQAAGTVTGSVLDSDGAEVAGAKVTLTSEATKTGFATATDGDGMFTFSGVPPGKFTLLVTSEGLSPVVETGTLSPKENYEFRPILMAVATVNTSVDAMTVQQQAEEELHIEEHQRLIGIIPNFYVVYNWDAAPLSTKQKYRLALRNVIDPVNTAISAAVAGYQFVENDFNGYGRGPVGYFSRFAANEGDLITGTFVGGAILPSLLHQDPRYFYMGRGTVMHRLLYAIASAVICKGDNGKWQPNYSSIGGDVAAGAIANAYYPASDKDGASIIIEQGLIGALADGLGNVVQEFLFKRVTPHSPQYSSTTQVSTPSVKTVQP